MRTKLIPLIALTGLALSALPAHAQITIVNANNTTFTNVVPDAGSPGANLAAATVAAIVIALNSVRAADLTWDTFPGDEAAITAGSGVWNTSGTNLVWNDGADNVAWTQTNTTTPLNAAIFAGEDGAADAYTVALVAQMAAQSLTFNSSGYRITGSTAGFQEPHNQWSHHGGRREDRHHHSHPRLQSQPGRPDHGWNWRRAESQRRNHRGTTGLN
jgi:hypothetical protein